MKIVTPAQFTRLTRGKVAAIARGGKLVPNPSGDYKPRRAPRRELLFMMLGHAPKWWPRDARGKIKPVGILVGGDGWVEGVGQPMTAVQVERAIELLRQDYRGKRPQFTRAKVSS